MLDEMAKAPLVLAVMPDGTLRVIKNVGGSRTQEDGVRALGERLHPDLLEGVFRHANTPFRDRYASRGSLSRNDACVTSAES